MFALAVLALLRRRSKASTLSCIFLEITGSIDRVNELQGPGFVNCKHFGESKVPRYESGVQEKVDLAWVCWLCIRDESGVHERDGTVGPGYAGSVHVRKVWCMTVGPWYTGSVHMTKVWCMRGTVGPG